MRKKGWEIWLVALILFMSVLSRPAKAGFFTGSYDVHRFFGPGMRLQTGLDSRDFAKKILFPEQNYPPNTEAEYPIHRILVFADTDGHSGILAQPEDKRTIEIKWYYMDEKYNVHILARQSKETEHEAEKHMLAEIEKQDKEYLESHPHMTREERDAWKEEIRHRRDAVKDQLYSGTLFGAIEEKDLRPGIIKIVFDCEWKRASVVATLNIVDQNIEEFFRQKALAAGVEQGVQPPSPVVSTPPTMDGPLPNGNPPEPDDGFDPNTEPPAHEKRQPRLNPNPRSEEPYRNSRPNRRDSEFADPRDEAFRRGVGARKRMTRERDVHEDQESQRERTQRVEFDAYDGRDTHVHEDVRLSIRALDNAGREVQRKELTITNGHYVTQVTYAEQYIVHEETGEYAITQQLEDDTLRVVLRLDRNSMPERPTNDDGFNPNTEGQGNSDTPANNGVSTPPTMVTYELVIPHTMREAARRQGIPVPFYWRVDDQKPVSIVFPPHADRVTAQFPAGSTVKVVLPKGEFEAGHWVYQADQSDDHRFAFWLKGQGGK